jgi:hypothetical protein
MFHSQEYQWYNISATGPGKPNNESFYPAGVAQIIFENGLWDQAIVKDA